MGKFFRKRPLSLALQKDFEKTEFWPVERYETFCRTGTGEGAMCGPSRGTNVWRHLLDNASYWLFLNTSWTTMRISQKNIGDILSTFESTTFPTRFLDTSSEYAQRESKLVASGVEELWDLIGKVAELRADELKQEVDGAILTEPKEIQLQ